MIKEIKNLMCLGTFLYTKFFGKLIGTDSLGNSYYESKDNRWFKKPNRWVMYGKKNKLIANIDSVWFKWLHYLSDEPPMKLTKKYNWIIEGGTAEYDKIQAKKSELVYDGNYSSWNPKRHK